jgi:hypothetical protein
MPMNRDDSEPSSASLSLVGAEVAEIGTIVNRWFKPIARPRPDVPEDERRDNVPRLKIARPASPAGKSSA